MNKKLLYPLLLLVLVGFSCSKVEQRKIYFEKKIVQKLKPVDTLILDSAYDSSLSIKKRLFYTQLYNSRP